MNIKRSLAFAGILAAVIGTMMSVDAAKHEEAAWKPLPQLNSEAPAVTLDGLDNQAYTVGGSREKLLWVNFWASWCPPCRKEAPDIARLANKYSGVLDVYAVNVTADDKAGDAAAFSAKYGYRFPVLLDRVGAATTSFEVRALPTSFLIDKDGIVRYSFHVLSGAKLEGLLSKFMEEYK